MSDEAPPGEDGLVDGDAPVGDDVLVGDDEPFCDDALLGDSALVAGGTVEQRLARARAALAEAEATASASAQRERATSARRASAASPRARGGGGRGRTRTRGRKASEAKVDLSSWPGDGPAPDWVGLEPGERADADSALGGSSSTSVGASAWAAAAETAVESAAGEALRRSRHASTDVDPDAREAEAQARQIVLRQLAMAPRSRAQLEDKLAAKDVEPEVAAAVLDRFEEVGLVDDEAYAEVLVRSQQESRGLSKRGLRHELRKKGVDPDIAEDALASIDAESERARAEELVASRMRRLHGLPKDVQMRRLAGFLARKGYPGDLSYAVIRDAVHNAQEHSRD